MTRRSLMMTLLAWLFCLAPALASGEGGHEALPLNAQQILGPFTNSTLMTWLAVGLIVLFCRAATRRMSLVPTGFQNFAEWAVETLYDFLGGLLGARLVKRVSGFTGRSFSSFW